ncbi:MAG: hypothetical protein KDE54_01465, partial [Caldilineaceae bacterium]|nr:hypothetical protein [Caldilineaceae bacterium]
TVLFPVAIFPVKPMTKGSDKRIDSLWQNLDGFNYCMQFTRKSALNQARIPTNYNIIIRCRVFEICLKTAEKTCFKTLSPSARQSQRKKLNKSGSFESRGVDMLSASP